MKVLKMKQLVLALGSLAALGAATQAAAVNTPPFTVNPSAFLGAGNTTYDGTVGVSFTGHSSELLHNTASQSSGYGFFNATSIDPKAAIDSGLGVAYGLYLTFELVSNGAFATGNTQTLQTLNFQVYADPGFGPPGTRTQLVDASTTAGGAGTEVSITQNADDVLLGFGSLIAGTSGVDALGGVFINAIQSFSLCTGLNTATTGGTPTSGTGIAVAGSAATTNCKNGDGQAFFVQPNPFYSLAFDAFNNTSQGVTINNDGTASISAGGIVDFNKVPEPGTVALFGIAVAGMALARRRKA